MAWSNPIAFRPGQVTFWTTVIYLALLIPILVVHNTVPSVPAEKKLPHGVNMTEAWHDLASLTKEFHPYNSRANDRVRDWLLLRTQEILDSNGVSWSSETDEPASASLSEHQATVFNDIVSNITFNETSKPPSYFEGNNVMVYIRGQDDDEGDWWKQPYAEIEHRAKAFGKGGVLVNSHYDSVSTGYGATDDGMGVITCLQLIRYFTVPQNKPRRGLVVLFNNGEEDLLNGARAFGKTPLLPFIHTFLNLEGAGAGGRATVFRATDTEVTNAYRRAPHPFSSVVSSDSFKLGMIRSQTDYVIWEKFGHRGIDMAFYSPRSLYHTNQDDVRHASQESLWHMLSGSLATVSGLSGDTGKTFIGPRPDGRKDMVANGKPTRGVWFDLFGEKLVLFRLRAMFAWSLTILIVSPLALLLITYLVHRSDKNYIFSTYVWIGEEPDREKVSTGGLKGLFRFPLALIVAGGLTVGAALLLRKVNPLIVHSSSYAVWAMSLSLFYFAFWTIMRGADFARPSALHRAYTHFWLFVIGWTALVAATVFEDRFNIASGYIAVFWQSQVFLSALVGALEFLALPKRKTFALEAQDDDEVRDHLHAVPHSDSLIAPSADEAEGESAVRDEEDEEEGPTETTALIGRSNDDNARTTFSTGYRRTLSNMLDPSRRDTEKGPNQPYLHEQNWSGSLPSSAWFLQFLLLGPFTIILSAPLALALSYSINQTGEDGSPLLLPYLLIAVFSILLLLPVTPFIHRVTHHVPLFLLLVFAGTLIYNLVAFPFSPANPCKIYFAQELDLDTGATKVVYTGLEQYIRPVISQIPSAAGKHLDCRHGNGSDTLVTCSYDAAELAPHLNPDIAPGIPPQKGYEGLITINTFAPGNNKATLMIDAVDTRACLLSFKKPVASVHVHGSDKEWDSRYGPVDSRHIDEFMLWRRDWDKTWVVDVEWDDEDSSSSSSLLVEGSHEVSDQLSDAMGGPDELKKRVASGLEGFVTCSWSDANTKGVIPAIDEAWQYAPTWVRVTKRRVGLVEGRKSFMM